MEKISESQVAEREPSGSFRSFVVWALAILMVYLLSTGPAVLLVQKKRIKPEALDAIYAPVEWLYENTFLAKPIRIYLHLWDPEEFDRNGDLK